MQQNKKKCVIKNRLQQLRDTHTVNSNKILSSLVDEEETKILNYINSHGFITNSLCRSELDLKKHKSVRLFNSLMKNEKIEKVGIGNRIKYVLKQE